MTIGISGAAGQLGRATTDLLLERVEPGDLVLVTRDPAQLEAYAGRGAAVRQGDFDDPDGAARGLPRRRHAAPDQRCGRRPAGGTAHGGDRGGEGRRGGPHRLHRDRQPDRGEPGRRSARAPGDGGGAPRERARVDDAPERHLRRSHGAGRRAVDRRRAARLQQRRRQDGVRGACRLRRGSGRRAERGRARQPGLRHHGPGGPLGRRHRRDRERAERYARRGGRGRRRGLRRHPRRVRRPAGAGRAVHRLLRAGGPRGPAGNRVECGRGADRTGRRSTSGTCSRPCCEGEHVPAGAVPVHAGRLRGHGCPVGGVDAVRAAGRAAGICSTPTGGSWTSCSPGYEPASTASR